MSSLNWFFVSGVVYPRCSRCESYHLIYLGKFKSDNSEYYKLECAYCGAVYTINPSDKTINIHFNVE